MTLDRRTFLQWMSAAGLAAVAAPGLMTRARAADAATGGPFFLFVHAGGGWDPTMLCDPKGRSGELDPDPVNHFDVGDILVALALDRLPLDRLPSERLVLDRRPRPRADDRVVLQACSGVPRTIGEVARFADRPLLDVAMALARLEQSGWLHQVDGWYEALGSPPP